MDKREKFMKIFAKVPEELRNDVLIIIKERPYTWDTAYIEIRDKTNTGKEILKALEELEIIWKKPQKKLKNL